jgi:hypothetical protein
MTPEILKTTLLRLKALQAEFNVLDLSDIICIYLKYQFIPPELELILQDSYSILKRHINDICI